MSARIFLAPFVVRRAGAAAAVVQPGAITYQGTDPTAFGFIVLFTPKKHGTLAKFSAERPGNISKTCLFGFLGAGKTLENFSELPDLGANSH